ncbi:hypothetical protein IHN63_06580 [Deinococcus sp. 6YEL10]|uniref:hypothetical protein n=1 Tax=Deinococcus sp. 6YEL10 TaxID=2745870 RepID=UPI001E2BE6CC|nr:hypothetical protein [Deinococcus sp. 6YEL10]MCD0160975.1 hypothetical protein [Deinococcus sp. 6YEL10]
MRDIFYFFGVLALISLIIFVVRGILKKPFAWRNAGISAMLWLIFVALAPSPSYEQDDQSALNSQSEVASNEPVTPQVNDVETAPAEEDTPSSNTSPEADSSLKRLGSTILPVYLNNSRNVGGDSGDDLGAGLWMYAEAEGYKCNETEAYASPSANSLKSDLKTDLENNGYAYTEINRIDGDEGELIIWKAVGDITAIGFFATPNNRLEGIMAICRATPE